MINWEYLDFLLTGFNVGFAIIIIKLLKDEVSEHGN